MPSSAPFGRAAVRRAASSAAAAAPARSSALIRSHWRLTSDAGPRLGVAEDVRMAAHDLRRDRGVDVGQVEDALLGGELGVEHDLEAAGRRAPRRARRAPRLERVVDLVGLLEEVLPQRLRGSARGPTGSRRAGAAGRLMQGIAHGARERPPRARPAGGRTGAARSAVASAPTVAPSAAPNRPTDGPPGRAGRGRRAASRPPGPWRPGSGSGSAASAALPLSARSTASGTSSSGPRWLERRRDQALGGDDLEAGGEVEAPAEARLRDERVEHGRRVSRSRVR